MTYKGEKIRVGIASFTDPRSVALAGETLAYETNCHHELRSALEEAGFEVIDPLDQVTDGKPISGSRDTETTSQFLLFRDPHCLVLGCWKWTDPMLAIDLVRRVNLPAMLYCKKDVQWTGLGCMSAIGAGLWQICPNEAAAVHERARDDVGKLSSWVRGVGSLQQMKRSKLVLWGGSYCLRMPHLQEDESELKAFLIGDILNEGQYILIKRAEHILANEPQSVRAFINWLKKGGARIERDRRMGTMKALQRQAALYLAAKCRLAELEEERIAGVSLRCQPELSEEYGVTGCTLPAFIPFPQDHDGPKTSLPTVCEGDIKGLLTSVLMNGIQPDIPATFGDIRDIEIKGKRYLIIANCGAASVYYAANSVKPDKVLPRLTLKGQCQGASGFAIGYRGLRGTLTVARLGKKCGEYLMQIGVGQAINVTQKLIDKMGWASMWPHVAIELDVDFEQFAQRTISNHYSFIAGDISAELRFACVQAGIRTTTLGGE